ncbi:NAD-dependent epimerase/dehydratase family protein [Nibricoccus sp. IMCC34717]|uniref:NAD-dependent epimerase/dehydratase family protein n=1 Tax=Nibricoccus sp. IMCC34717 TaxID=3034021 RepID=UPI00384AFA52
MNSDLKTVLVTGGAGYVGSVLTPLLLEAGYKVRVLDLFMYGDTLKGVAANPNLSLIKGDIRDQDLLRKSLSGVDAVIHLACISNDPSFELDANLGKSINFDAFIPLVEISKELGVKRFIYASSSSVYGIKDEPNVTEELELKPLTDYSKFKAMCEDELMKRRAPGFTVLTIRPATVCGYSPRLRLDLSVNILTNHAINKGKITVFGGAQLRPNFHVRDCAELYVKCLGYAAAQIDGKIYNAGYENLSINAIAEKVRSVVGSNVAIEATPTNDNRSYHISSDKIKRELGFTPRYTIEDAIRELKAAFEGGKVVDPMTNTLYYNIKRMQETKLA